MAASPFEGLKPELLWKHFESLTRIPRCSGNEAASGRFAREWADKLGFTNKQDEAGNVVVQVPATAGREKASTVVLQGHLDMVGEKDSSSPHDFDKDPIKVLREGDWITADGTTLGADNAVGLAAGMAVAEDRQAEHGPLELLLTVEEEIGLNGAQALQPGFVTGKTMLNLDSEEIGAVYVGCAGGADTTAELAVQREGKVSGDLLQVTLAGFRGGHSGLDINTGRGNAVKLLALLLGRLRDSVDFGLLELAGGDKHNAIPREATAVLAVDAAGRQAVEQLADAFREDLAAMFGKTDPGFKVELGHGKSEAAPLSKASRDALIDMMLAMPHGVLAMSQAVEGLVETSTNLAVVKLEGERAEIQESTRSSVAPALAAARAGLFAVARLAGARPIDMGGYPGWQPDMDSRVLARAINVHEGLFGKRPEIKAIHAGLECGIIGEKFGGMDMLSFGPQIENPHSPSERMRIDTVDKFYDFLKALLADLSA